MFERLRLPSVMLNTALIKTIRSGDFQSTWRRNVMSGIVVGIVAVPLSMGLAIAVGLPPQHGLYTAIVAGIVIALLGGSPVNISGPTAAFVVILAPVVSQHGLSGLLISGLLAGIILVGMGVLKLGRFVQTIPYPIVIGFTAGIGTVIASMQLKDLVGLSPTDSGAEFFPRMHSYILALPSYQWQEAVVGFFTLATIFFWKKVPLRVPGYLVAMLLGTGIALIFNQTPSLPDVDTIATRFNYMSDGMIFYGIPAVAPTFAIPWKFDVASLDEALTLFQSLFGAAFAIAILGALESLLCAVVADGMTGRQHDPDAELIGQGVGNIIVPFFGGIPATAAIARTALNVRSGGSTPLAAAVHALFILVIVLTLAPWLSLVPMATMAAILVAVAWNMSEAHHVVHLLRTAPGSDVSVFWVCYGLTVVVDMQVAVAAGMVLAAAMFMRRMSELTRSTLLTERGVHPHQEHKADVVVFDVDGPLFFGAAHKALKVVTSVDISVRHVVLDLSGVPVIDTTGMVNIRSLAVSLRQRDIKLYLYGVSDRIRKKLERFGLSGDPHHVVITDDLTSIE
ncbi:MAG: C4-dicarboxylic acid transporter DauA [Gammaproteobacteria bacterium]